VILHFIDAHSVDHGYSDSIRVSNYVAMFFRAVSQKRLNPGSPNLVHMVILRYSHAQLILGARGQRSRSCGSKVSERLS